MQVDVSGIVSSWFTGLSMEVLMMFYRENQRLTYQSGVAVHFVIETGYIYLLPPRLSKLPSPFDQD